MKMYPFTPLPFPNEMARWDSATISETGIPAAILMENAGQATLKFLVEKIGRLAGKKILMFMGRGNNGGDAAVLARLAYAEGAEVLVCHLHPLPELTPCYCGNLYDVNAAPTDVHIGLAKAAGVQFFQLAQAYSPLPCIAGISSSQDNSWEKPNVIVDGLLGTGFKGPARSEYAAVIKRINMFRNIKPSNCAEGCCRKMAEADEEWPGLDWPDYSDAAGQVFGQEPETSRAGKALAPANISKHHQANTPFVLSLDIPSGMCGYSGKPMPCAVVAHATITFQAPKPGMIMPIARPYVGEMRVAPVGIPREVRQRYPPKLALIMPDATAVTPNPYTFAHKGAAGKVLIIGGSPGMSGAPVLAALAAFRAGAGRVAIACPALLEDQVKIGFPDIITLPLGKSLEWTEEAAAQLVPQLEAWDAIVLGPGLGRSKGAYHLVKTILRSPCPPALIDADALNIVAEHEKLFADLRWQDIITPHPGEAARLLGISTKKVQEARLEAMDELLKRTRSTIVLKGQVSIIGSGGRIALSPFIEPNLALAGSGDVLSGILGAYLAQDISNFSAACAAVYLHGMAGRMLHAAYPFRGNLPSEIAHIIPQTKLALTKVPADWVPDLNDRIYCDNKQGNNGNSENNNPNGPNGPNGQNWPNWQTYSPFSG